MWLAASTRMKPIEAQSNTKPLLQGSSPQPASELPAKKARIRGVGSEAVETPAYEAVKDDAALLRRRVAMLEQELADSEHTHQLRSASFLTHSRLIKIVSIKQLFVMNH